MTWTNITPPSQGKDLLQQIAAKYPNYIALIYGNLKSTKKTVDSGQGNPAGSGGPGWIERVQLSTGELVKLIHTIDGTDCPNCRWGNLHNASAAEFPNNRPLHQHGPAFHKQYERGARRTVQRATHRRSPRRDLFPAIRRWFGPRDSSYDNSCPAGNPFESLGASGNQCVTFKMTQPCNAAPSAAELIRWPCGWNSNYSQPFSLRPGDSNRSPWATRRSSTMASASA